MAPYYKIWLHIEEIDEENDHYEDVGAWPEPLQSFPTEQQARDWAWTNIVQPFGSDPDGFDRTAYDPKEHAY